MRSRKFLSGLFGLLAAAALSAAPKVAAAQSQDIPFWLQSHVGVGDGQIAPVVLRRARALYFRKLRAGAIRNPCYFAMDATRPNDLGHGALGRRFYVICESRQVFRAIPAGHGGGRDLRGMADFENGRICARNFGNAEDSKLTTGGAYITREIKTSFKGYYPVASARHTALYRSFVQFDGEGEAANARERVIGGHAAELLRNMCRRKVPGDPHADRDGYVAFGNLVFYAGGRSNGCTSWSPQDAAQVIPIIRDDPTTLYIYPDSDDIDAVARTVKAGRPPASAGLYWNAFCLRQIRAPKYWSQRLLGPILAQYERDHPRPPPQPLPLCRRQ
jgi:hypothetical protein